MTLVEPNVVQVSPVDFSLFQLFHVTLDDTYGDLGIGVSCVEVHEARGEGRVGREEGDLLNSCPDVESRTTVQQSDGGHRGHAAQEGRDIFGQNQETADVQRMNALEEQKGIFQLEF